MTDHIPAEAVEAGARALFEESQELDQDNSWDDALPDDWREAWRYQAREVIAAALPFLRPEPSRERLIGAIAGSECDWRDATPESIADAVLALFGKGAEG